MNVERTITKDKGPPDKTTPNIYPNELMKLHEENLNKNKIIESGKDEGMGNGGEEKRWGDKWQDSSGQWCWGEELHGDDPRISLPTLKVAHGETRQYAPMDIPRRVLRYRRRHDRIWTCGRQMYGSIRQLRSSTGSVPRPHRQRTRPEVGGAATSTECGRILWSSSMRR